MHQSASFRYSTVLLLVSLLSETCPSENLSLKFPKDVQKVSDLIQLKAESKSPLGKVAFGSCNDQSFPQPLWGNIVNHAPELWIWMGDNIYADIREKHEQRFWKMSRSFMPADEATLIRRYNTLLANEGYLALLRQCPVIGVWDDHDYGINDGDKEYRNKDISQKVFLEFIQEPKQSPRWMQKGVYTAYTIGPSEQSVKVILLDVRYHRDAYDMPDGDFLGDKQWEWLEQELVNSKASFNIIVSSIQVLPADRFFPAECWDRFPRQRLRLIELILRSQAKGIILLSGDVHFSEINQVQCTGDDAAITEITSSGMTHSWMQFHLPAFKLLANFIFLMANLILPWDFRPTRNSFFAYLNWGEITFDWNQHSVPVATVRISGRDDKVELIHHISSKPTTSNDRMHWNASNCKSPRQMGDAEQMLRRGVLIFAILAFVFTISMSVPIILTLLWRTMHKRRFTALKNKEE